MFVYDEKVMEEIINKTNLKNRVEISNTTEIYKVINIDELINYVYAEIASMIKDEFILEKAYIGENSIKEFLEFFSLGYLWLKNDCNINGPMSLQQYYKSFEDRIYELNISNIKTLERRWNDLNKYNAIYNKNHKYSKNNINNFKGHSIYENQKNEFEFLLKYYDNSIVKKIRLGKFDKLTFTELNEYVNMARNEISKSDDKNKSMRYYKFERRTHMELIKLIIKNINSNKRFNVDNEIIYLLGILSNIPDIKNTHKYVNKFFELTQYEDRYRLICEVKYLGSVVYNLLIGYCIYILEGYDDNDLLNYIKINENRYFKMYGLQDYSIELDMTKETVDTGNLLLSNLKNCRDTKK